MKGDYDAFGLSLNLLGINSLLICTKEKQVSDYYYFYYF